MVVADVDGVRFQVRAAAVILHEGRVLLHRAERDAFWALPGGRVDVGEAAEDAVRREVREETGADVTVDRLLWVVENFFRYDGRRYHELGWYFLARFADARHPFHAAPAFLAHEPTVRLVYAWHPVADLPRFEVYPSFLREALVDLPPSPAHVVHRDVPRDPIPR